MENIGTFYAVDSAYLSQLPSSPISLSRASSRAASSRASSRATSPAPSSLAYGNLRAPVPRYPDQGPLWPERGPSLRDRDNSRIQAVVPERSFSYPVLESSQRSYSPSTFTPPASRSSSPMRMSPHLDSTRSLRHAKSFVQPTAVHGNREEMRYPKEVPLWEERPGEVLSTPHPSHAVLPRRTAAGDSSMPILEEHEEAISTVADHRTLRASKSHGTLGRRSRKASSSSRYEAFPVIQTEPRDIPQPLPAGQGPNINFHRSCYDDFGKLGKAAMRNVLGLDINNPTMGLDNPGVRPMEDYGKRYHSMSIRFNMPGYPRASDHGVTTVSVDATQSELATAACAVVREVIAVIRNTKEPCDRAYVQWTVGTARGIGIENLTPMGLTYAGGGKWYVNVRHTPR
ncbi:hypothetical protein OF83DRAFT_837874 [Amylostereum chailletii]|nr:hypothetical protein OF83DRAFT_837874 [Amylostereum chailletii]